jgi:ribosomal peptide maturation radical SAM protein 1
MTKADSQSPSTHSIGNQNPVSKTKGARVLLICPPFQYPHTSSLCVAQLATYLKQNGIDCQEAYLHLEFLRIIGIKRYENINSAKEGRANGNTAELMFAEGLHGSIADEKWKTDLASLVGTPADRRSMLERFEQRVVSRLEYERPKIVGLTTSYNQLMAALWIARIVKRVLPESITIFGGTACFAPMGPAILKGYPQVDYVVGGFGEIPLLDLALGKMPSSRFIECDEPIPIEATPLPDYRPFVLESAELFQDMLTSLLFQTSRGCWWGQKKHCTFCGLNGGQMVYSAKSSMQVVEDIRTLWERHNCRLIATDSIMSRDHLKHAVPDLGRFHQRPAVFYEMKANLNEEDVISMARASIHGQMGIESLSTRLLKIMNKGLSSIRAVGLLKWCREQDLNVVWNQLCGIPGETDEDYENQIALMKNIPHFQPPYRVNPVVLDRFSPYFNNYLDYGWTEIAPIPQYRQAHPHLDEQTLCDIAYHFEAKGGLSMSSYLKRFQDGVAEWKARHEQGDGLFWNTFDGLMKVENRVTEKIVVNETVRRVIECTHTIQPVSRVIDQTGCESSLLDEMANLGFLYMENKNVVNLTVRVSAR